MTVSRRVTRPLPALLSSALLALTGCNASDTGTESADTAESGTPQAELGQDTEAATNDGTVDMSAHAATIHKMTTEMVHLMDDVSRTKIMQPPLKVSDARNAFMARLDWIGEMSPDEVAKMREATAGLDALIAEIRAHEAAAGDAALEARLKKIEDWNRSIEDGLPE